MTQTYPFVADAPFMILTSTRYVRQSSVEAQLSYTRQAEEVVTRLGLTLDDSQLLGAYLRLPALRKVQLLSDADIAAREEREAMDEILSGLSDSGDPDEGYYNWLTGNF